MRIPSATTVISEQEFKDGELTDVEHDEYTAEADGYTDDDYADVSDDDGFDDEE